VNDLVLMKVRDGAQKTPNDPGGLPLPVGIARVQIPAAAQLENQKQAVVIVEGFKSLDNVGMVQLLQNFHCVAKND
jgi:hypothetical protein